MCILLPFSRNSPRVSSTCCGGFHRSQTIFAAVKFQFFDMSLNALINVLGDPCFVQWACKEGLSKAAQQVTRTCLASAQHITLQVALSSLSEIEGRLLNFPIRMLFQGLACLGKFLRYGPSAASPIPASIIASAGEVNWAEVEHLH